MYKLEEVKNKSDWQPYLLNKHVLFSQSFYYSEWQKEYGLNTYNIVFKKDNKPILYGVFIKCPLFSKFNYIYSPYGPVLSNEFTLKDAQEFKKHITEFFKKRGKNTVFIRLDFTPSSLPFIFPATKAKWFTRQGACFQPRREWVIDLTLSEEELLKQMHQKTRYNVRLAEKKGIKISIHTNDMEKYFDDFYRLLQYTSQKNNYHIHDKNYYKLSFKYAKENDGFLVIARKENEKDILTANLVIAYKDYALFAYGGSSERHRNLMPNYLAHFKAMLYAKQNGIKYYSFGGYFDKDGPKIKKQTLQARSRFSVFKRKFGGFVLEHGDMHDIVLNRFIYILWLAYKLIKHP